MRPPQRSNTRNKVEEKPVLDIVAVLASYGMDAPTSSSWVKFRCHGERKASAVVNSSEGAMNCFSCGLKGDALSVIMQMDSCSFQIALVKYKEITGEDAPGFGRGSSKRTYMDSAPVEKASYESGGWLASALRRG